MMIVIMRSKTGNKMINQKRAELRASKSSDSHSIRTNLGHNLGEAGSSPSLLLLVNKIDFLQTASNSPITPEIEEVLFKATSFPHPVTETHPIANLHTMIDSNPIQLTQRLVELSQTLFVPKIVTKSIPSSPIHIIRILSLSILMSLISRS